MNAHDKSRAQPLKHLPGRESVSHHQNSDIGFVRIRKAIAYLMPSVSEAVTEE